jgi:hypothetical protein
MCTPVRGRWLSPRRSEFSIAAHLAELRLRLGAGDAVHQQRPASALEGDHGFASARPHDIVHGACAEAQRESLWRVLMIFDDEDRFEPTPPASTLIKREFSLYVCEDGSETVAAGRGTPDQ